MRLYLPVTSTVIEKLIADGEVAVEGGYAVTPALREWYDNDDEELEYVASMSAAEASLALIAADPSAKRRRAVLALEVPDITAFGTERASVLFKQVVRLDAVESALIDSIEAQPDIDRALERWGQDDDDARFALEQANSHELLWFARQELPFIF